MKIGKKEKTFILEIVLNQNMELDYFWVYKKIIHEILIDRNHCTNTVSVQIIFFIHFELYIIMDFQDELKANIVSKALYYCLVDARRNGELKRSKNT